MKLFIFPGWGFSPRIFKKIVYHVKEASEIFSWDTPLSHEGLAKIQEKISQEKKVVLVGWSMGGFVALNFIGRPEVKGALLISSGGSFARSTVNSYGVSKKVLSVMRRELINDREKVTQEFIKNALKPSRTNSTMEAYFTEKNTERLNIGLNFLTGYTFYDKIPENKKVTLCQGQKDQVFDHRGARQFADMHSLRYVEYKDEGHLLPHLKADALVRELGRILKECND